MQKTRFLHFLTYALLAFFATDNLLFGAQGTKYITDFLGSGMNYVGVLNENDTYADVGITTASVFTSRNGTWLPWPVNNKNYVRGDTYISGTVFDEQNSAYYVNPAGTSNLNQVAVTTSITGPTPTVASNLATKAYVDAAAVSGAGGGGISCNQTATRCVFGDGTCREVLSRVPIVPARCNNNPFYSGWPVNCGDYSSSMTSCNGVIGSRHHFSDSQCHDGIHPLGSTTCNLCNWTVQTGGEDIWTSCTNALN